jgi:hypothetical protein
MYDPLLGRMLSPDSYVVDPYYAQDYNRYSYARNNPLKYTDPTGEEVWAPDPVPGYGYVIDIGEVVIYGQRPGSGGVVDWFSDLFGYRISVAPYSPVNEISEFEFEIFKARGSIYFPGLDQLSFVKTVTINELPNSSSQLPPFPTPPPAPAVETVGGEASTGSVLYYIQLGLDLLNEAIESGNQTGPTVPKGTRVMEPLRGWSMVWSFIFGSRTYNRHTVDWEGRVTEFLEPITGMPPVPGFAKGASVLKGVNQLNKLAKTGKVPKTIIRFDAGKGTKNLPMDEVHFSNGAALYRNGTWRHGSKILTNSEKLFLQQHGWTIP